jgi:hypothetical protein
MKSGNLNFLEPSGPLQACNGTALPILYLNRQTSQGVINLVFEELSFKWPVGPSDPELNAKTLVNSGWLDMSKLGH